MAKEPKAVPVIGTKEYFSFAATAERGAVADGKATNEARQAAARNVYRGAAAWFAQDPTADADQALSLYYVADADGKATMPKGDTLNSRKREWNNIREAARTDGEKTLAIWPEPKEGVRNITRKLFLEGCTMVHKQPGLSSVAILAKLREKKVAAVANAGDLLLAMFGPDGTMMDLFRRFPTELEPMLPGLNAARAVYAKARADGQYLTTDEARAKAEAVIVPLEISKAA